MNIVLIGLRGSGKTKLGQTIATELNWNFIDLDNEIEKNQKMDIPQIVKKNDWNFFRKIEKAIIETLSTTNNTVIATGGGAILDKKNVINLKKIGQLIYLHIKPEIAAQRIKNSKNRPPLTTNQSVLDEMEELYEERHKKYLNAANLIIERTNNLKKDARLIIKTLNIT